MKFAKEKLVDIWHELEPLFVKHWAEIAHYKDIQLAPDVQLYFKMEDLGIFHAFTARDEGSGKLIGYQGFFVKASLHYSGSIQAAQDVLFMDADYRGKGWKFIGWCDNQLRTMGVQVTSQRCKAAHNFGPMLERQGYELQDLYFTKRLDKE